MSEPEENHPDVINNLQVPRAREPAIFDHRSAQLCLLDLDDAQLHARLLDQAKAELDAGATREDILIRAATLARSARAPSQPRRETGSWDAN